MEEDGAVHSNSLIGGGIEQPALPAVHAGYGGRAVGDCPFRGTGEPQLVLTGPDVDAGAEPMGAGAEDVDAV